MVVGGTGGLWVVGVGGGGSRLGAPGIRRGRGAQVVCKRGRGGGVQLRVVGTEVRRRGASTLPPFCACAPMSITVMARGKVFAEGTPAEIASHAAVQEIYLGTGHG